MTDNWWEGPWECCDCERIIYGYSHAELHRRKTNHDLENMRGDGLEYLDEDRYGDYDREKANGPLLREVWEPNKDDVFIQHSDGATYSRLEEISVEQGGAIYIHHRYTEIKDPKWYHRPLYWLFDKL